mmetsp:Transcript_32992/g.94772  ORF Transcript_32992/g.94772 Transcript_32992/m.94772 type:complete len:283 (+) Transcript_32992:701-1549(+)
MNGCNVAAARPPPRPGRPQRTPARPTASAAAAAWMRSPARRGRWTSSTAAAPHNSSNIPGSLSSCTDPGRSCTTPPKCRRRRRHRGGVLAHPGQPALRRQQPRPPPHHAAERPLALPSVDQDRTRHSSLPSEPVPPLPMRTLRRLHRRQRLPQQPAALRATKRPGAVVRTLSARTPAAAFRSPRPLRLSSSSSLSCPQPTGNSPRRPTTLSSCTSRHRMSATPPMCTPCHHPDRRVSPTSAPDSEPWPLSGSRPGTSKRTPLFHPVHQQATAQAHPRGRTTD